MINKATKIQDIWNIFYNRLKDTISNAEITGGVIVSIKKITSSYNDDNFSKKSDFPMIIVETPKLEDSGFTFGKEKSIGDILIETYTTQAESAEKFSSDILDSIETYKDKFADNGLKKVKGKLVDVDFAENGGFKVHVRRMKFSFEYIYNKTKTY